jgi:hypothetical protein
VQDDRSTITDRAAGVSLPRIETAPMPHVERGDGLAFRRSAVAITAADQAEPERGTSAHLPGDIEIIAASPGKRPAADREAFSSAFASRCFATR